MRKDKLSSFQAKKQKLLEIKRLHQELIEEYTQIQPMIYFKARENMDEIIKQIWEIVKDEK